MSYVEAMMISLILGGIGGILGFTLADLKWQMQIYEANREDAKVYEEEDE